MVLTNNCTDGTVQAVRDVEASGILATLALRLTDVELAGAEAHVGTARRMALEAGADWLEADGQPDGILLTTDADARLPADWVTANLRALEAADVVGGRLVIDEDGTADPDLVALHARIERYWSGVRRLEDLLDPPPHDPAPPRRPYRGEPRRSGRPVPVGRAAGAALRRGQCPRRAPARQRGAPAPLPGGACAGLVPPSGAGLGGGMATEMLRRARVLHGEAYLLPEAAHWQALILRRAALRRAFHLDPEARVAACGRLGLAPEDLDSVGACPNDIAFVERADRILESRSAPARECALDQAVADLDALALSLKAAA